LKNYEPISILFAIENSKKAFQAYEQSMPSQDEIKKAGTTTVLVMVHSPVIFVVCLPYSLPPSPRPAPTASLHLSLLPTVLALPKKAGILRREG
jgi:hypothetical protein